ncbi:NAD(P)/FAD-dependent oxidoreductase [Agromyces aerolatus]|uniref:NAD(P)/FAD-dependent oxidoreductase n=1 Tax=Agromyces sp. LY-1074 TaxID=3074080 RepID=UPI0028609363|nr:MULTISPECIES: FAD-dependent oxidoreductase [unclassified Agromyces]MDR5699220.1 FAD-dependent oxidoreductase [Agromyces sp. LY-1074]MDR5705516.1 FAD-dependent oxidoreductase [Agromyces sp. LY-1358]
MSTSNPEHVVIVGAGLAGATAAKTLREEGFDRGIHLIGAERHAPYIRPPLSKGYLAGTEGRDSIDVVDSAWYREHDVDLQTGARVAALDRDSSHVRLESGATIRYDALLLATGSTPRRLPIPGAELGGVHVLRTVDDCETIRGVIAEGGTRVVLIGSGWIGMEVAATARSLGNEVTVLERDPVPLAAALGEELGRYFADLHRRNGVSIRPSVAVDAIVGAHGTATGVRMADGEVVAADLVVVGVGAVPAIELARDAGLAVDGGVLVDAALRTSDPRIFAAGDIAAAEHPIAGVRLRSEHWANALTGGAVAARSMLGQAVVHDAIPYFYTDQFDLGMEYAGFAPLTREARIVYRGDPSSGTFVAFWMQGPRVVAGMNVNVWDVNESIQALVRSGASVDERMLRDESIPLDDVADVGELGEARPWTPSAS